MRTPPTWQPIPDDLANLKPPTREDAIEVMERRAGMAGARQSIRFEDASVGRRCANGEYGTGDFCRDAKAKHDATREREIAATLERLTGEYDKNVARRQEIEANNTEALAVETQRLKARYMAAPGATAEGFEKALPDLLEAQRRQAALTGQSEHERLVEQMRAAISI